MSMFLTGCTRTTYLTVTLTYCTTTCIRYERPNICTKVISAVVVRNMRGSVVEIMLDVASLVVVFVLVFVFGRG